MNDCERPAGRSGGGKRVFIIHGYGAAPEKHWFPWLKRQLEEEGSLVDVLPLPDAGQPVLADWLACLRAHVGTVDRNTFFVAHSLGCVTLLGFLDSLDAGSRFGGMILVSGFNRPVDGLSELDEFAAQKIDVVRVAGMADAREVIAARDDGVVPASASHELAIRLKADFFELQKGGHFMGDDGFVAWPFVHGRLRAMMEGCPA